MSANPDKSVAGWLYRPQNRRKLWWGFSLVLAATVLVQTVVDVHGHFGFDGIFGFNAGYGFLACAAMVIVAKLLGVLLKRPEGYYNHDV